MKDCSFCGKPLPTLAEFMAEAAGKTQREFKPCWIFNQAGQQIEVYWSNEPAYTEQVNDQMSLHYRQGTLADGGPKEVIGVTIYGVNPKAVYTL